MERPDHIDVLHQMRQVEAPVTSAEAEHARRQRVTARIAELQADFVTGAPRRASKKWFALGAVVIGAAACWLTWITFDQTPANDGNGAVATVVGGSITIRGPAKETTSRSLSESIPLDLETEILVDETTAELRMPSETVVTASGGSRLRMSRQRVESNTWREYLYLGTGKLDLNVPKLGAKRRLVVETADASIEVRGTRFSVSVPDASNKTTRVNVSEGQVFVRTSVGMSILTAGQMWDSASSPREANEEGRRDIMPSQPPAANEATSVPSKTARTQPTSPTPHAAASNTSELTDANRMMQAALLAKTNGMTTLALQRFVEIIQKHPGTEAAATARAERFRLLRRLGRHAAAQRAAQDYLAAHPNGFASAEANALLNDAD